MRTISSGMEPIACTASRISGWRASMSRQLAACRSSLRQWIARPASRIGARKKSRPWAGLRSSTASSTSTPVPLSSASRRTVLVNCLSAPPAPNELVTCSTRSRSDRGCTGGARRTMASITDWGEGAVGRTFANPWQRGAPARRNLGEKAGRAHAALLVVLQPQQMRPAEVETTAPYLNARHKLAAGGGGVGFHGRLGEHQRLVLQVGRAEQLGERRQIVGVRGREERSCPLEQQLDLTVFGQPKQRRDGRSPEGDVARKGIDAGSVVGDGEAAVAQPDVGVAALQESVLVARIEGQRIATNVDDLLHRTIHAQTGLKQAPAQSRRARIQLEPATDDRERFLEAIHLEQEFDG